MREIDEEGKGQSMIRMITEGTKTFEWELYKLRRRLRLKNKRPVIIASNCVGGIIYKDLKLPFYSPTINLFIPMDDYIRFLENLKWYLKQPIVPACEEGISYPVGMAADIKIYFMHYDTFEEAVKAWEKRKKRMLLNPDNLFIFGCERGKCTYETLRRFDRLPYKNKVVFTHREYPEFSSAVCIPGFEEQEELGNVLEFQKNSFWRRRYMDSFDYVSFLNKSHNKFHKPLISVIVPVYQSKPYIDTCVQSVLGQTYSNLELILVDDGSKDDSKAVCERLGDRDPRIRVLAQEHKGVSAARNAGMRAARGKYLFFLDSDDAIHPGLLEELCQLAEESQAAVSACAYHSMPSENFDKRKRRQDRRKCKHKMKRPFYLKNQEVLRSFIFVEGLESWHAIGGKLICRFRAEELWFDEKISNGEDTKYMYELLERGADAVVLPFRGYYYRRRNNSISRQTSIEAYKSIYACDCYIRDKEIRYGRTDYAQQWERYMVSRISWWYASSHMCEDEILRNYTLELERTERSSGFWKKLGVRIKLQYMLAFHCYPVYSFFCFLREILREIIEL